MPRNVIDKFSGWTNELINQKLRETSFSFSTFMEQIIGDYNLSVLVRNSNAFNAKKVFYYGPRKKFDKRGCVGTQFYTDINYLSSIEEMMELKKEYIFIGVDCVPSSIPMETFEWPKNTLMIFGEEGKGISKEVLDMCDNIVHITQYGSVRSLNVGTSSGIAMYDYINKFSKK